MINIQFSNFILKREFFVSISGLKIPKITSIAVTKLKKPSTHQILVVFDLKVLPPAHLKIVSLCSCAMLYFYWIPAFAGITNNLYQIEKCEYEYPDQIYKVPIQSHFFNHFIVPSSFISSNDDIEEYNDVNHHP